MRLIGIITFFLSLVTVVPAHTYNNSRLLDVARRVNTIAVQTLIKGSTRISLTDNDSHTAMSRASTYGRSATAEYWKKLKKYNNSDILIIIALSFGLLFLLKFFITPKKISKEIKLHSAVREGNIHKVKKLLDKEAKIDSRYTNSIHTIDWTVLMWAAEKGYKSIVKLLLDRGADVNIKSKDGWTALLAATYNNYPDIVKVLLDNAADVNAKDNNGRTALMAAAAKGSDDINEILLEAGADVNERDNDGNTALIMAALEYNYEILKSLLEAGADAKITANFPSDPTTQTMIKTIIKDDIGNHNLETLPDIFNGWTALIAASISSHAEIIQILIDSGVDISINAKTKYGLSALNMAVDRNKPDIVKILLDAGADAYAKDKNGCTASMSAMKGKNIAIAEMLPDFEDTLLAYNSDTQQPIQTKTQLKIPYYILEMILIAFLFGGPCVYLYKAGYKVIGRIIIAIITLYVYGRRSPGGVEFFIGQISGMYAVYLSFRLLKAIFGKP